MTLDQPLSVALVGTGNRSRQVYRPLFEALKPWMKLVAVCDPVRESTDAFAEAAGVPAFYDLKELVRARPMEAALVVTPVPSHHSIAVYLLSHGIPVNVETSMCSLLVQAQEMVDAARDNNTILRVGENFFRFPFDRMMRLIADDGFVGPVKRLTCWHDHTGYHNNSVGYRSSARIRWPCRPYPTPCPPLPTTSCRTATTRPRPIAPTSSGSPMAHW